MWNPARITASLLTDGQRSCSPPPPHVGLVTDGQRFLAARWTPSEATAPDADSLTDSQRDRVAGVDLVADGHRDPVPSQQGLVLRAKTLTHSHQPSRVCAVRGAR